MKVYFQHHGYLHCDMRWLLNAYGYATRSNPEPPTPWYDSPSITAVIDHPDGRILFDTSCPRDWRRRWDEAGITESFNYDATHDHEFLDARLHQLGLEPSDFTQVVLSHLHYDHAGNLRLFDGSGAKLLAHHAEIEGALGIAGTFDGAHIKEDYVDGFTIEPIDGEVELAEGVKVLELPGHTWGTIGLLLELKSGPMILTSDAIYMKASYGPPPIGSPFNWSSLDWLRSVEKVRQLAEKRNATLIFGHDKELVDHGLRLSPDFYE